MTIETGEGIEDADSYVTVAQADAYFASHPRASSWSALSTPNKEAFLIHATRTLDAGVRWKGFRVDIEQALEWPRQNIEIEGRDWDETVVPRDVRNAVCELAVDLATNGLRDSDSANAGIASLGIGNGAVDITFDPKTEKDLLGKLAPRYVGRFIYGSGHRGAVPTTRV